MTLADMLMLYTFLLMGCVVVLQIYCMLRERANRWELSRPRLLRCTTCNRVFLQGRQSLASRCPRCHGVSTTYIQ